MEENNKKKFRISLTEGIILICVAGLFELPSAIPIIGGVFAAIYWYIAGAFFWSKGMGLFSGKRVATMGVSLVIEWIPAISALPSLIAGTIVILLLVRMEDVSGKSLINPLKKGIMPPKIPRRPLNNSGVRKPRSNDTI